jgi:hypothetical protein
VTELALGTQVKTWKKWETQAHEDGARVAEGLSMYHIPLMPAGIVHENRK